MPEGKPAGVRCTQLDSQNHCLLFERAERPEVCLQFKAELALCGESREQALTLITILELEA